MSREIKGINEIVPGKFDYSDESESVAISAVVLSVTVQKGVDVNVAQMIYGAYSVVGAVVFQLIRNGVVGNFYRVTCRATFTDGRVLERHYDIEVVA